MAKKLVINKAGFYNVRQQPKVRADLERRAEAVQKAAVLTGYEVSSGQGKRDPQGRWRAAVYAATVQAKVDNRRHNTLVRAFGAARG